MSELSHSTRYCATFFETVVFFYSVDQRDSAMYSAKVAKVLDDIGTY